jgi:uncharacterized membrane protein YesL
METDRSEREVIMELFRFVRATILFVMENLFDIALVTVAWLLLQLPIVTAPAATVGLFYFARQAWLQDEAQFRDFVEGMRKYFWKSWLIVLPLVLMVLVLAYDTVFFLAQDQPTNRLWASLPMAGFGFLLVVQNYVFVFFVREEGALWTSIRRALLLALSNPVFTFVLLLLTLLYFLALLVTRIGLVIIFVGPVAVLQTRTVQRLLARRGVQF